MTTDERYQDVVDGIALARRTVEQTARVIRDAMDNGDDPVIFLHNLAGSLGKESPFQSGGQGSAVYVVACFLLAESGFFEDPDLRSTCICTGPPDAEYLATCPIHRGSWAETLEIMADPEIMADLAECDGEHDDLRCSEHNEPCCSVHTPQCTAVDICCCGCPEIREELGL